MGIRSFDQNTLIVYGQYGFVPAILYSVDGGNTFKLIFQSQLDPSRVSLSNGVADMDFAPGTNIGFAVDEDRILKTTDKGLTWSVVYAGLGSQYKHVQALDVNNVFAAANYYAGSGWENSGKGAHICRWCRPVCDIEFIRL